MKFHGRDSGDRVCRVAYLLLLLIVSLLVFSLFVLPVQGVQGGLNHYERARFLDMVNGTAFKPFVYRALLPTTVRVSSALTPVGVKHAFAEAAQESESIRITFEVLEWETSAAYEYCVAAVLMTFCLMAFAHTATLYTLRLCPVTDTLGTRALLGTLLLIGLVPFFRYAAYLYDPPQLFLFTLALYWLATSRLMAFVVTFVLCCINKETAVLLIPLCALVLPERGISRKIYWTLLFSLASIFGGISALLTLVYRSNPGSVVELHFQHNLDWAASMRPGVVISVLMIGTLIAYRWKEKHLFLRRSFLCTFPPLLGFALVLGYVDEWRGYYEAYASAFALMTHSVVRLRQQGHNVPLRNAG